MKKTNSPNSRKISSSHKDELQLIFHKFERMETERKEKKRKYLRKNLWMIPQPESETFEGRGEKNLYHFTRENHINTILKYGIIFGDVVLSSWDGLNAPNLTTESRFHNPANAEVDIIDENEYYRLTVKCPTDEDKLFNFEWFDKTYCLNENRNTIRRINESNKDNNKIRGNYNGNIDKQYIYKGHITPKMIKEVCKWNKETEYWDRVNKKELKEICSTYEKLPFNNMMINSRSDSVPFTKTRIFGHQITDDTTGMVLKYHQLTDHKEVNKKLYELTDWLSLNLKGNPLTQWRISLTHFLTGSDFKISDLVDHTIKFYNRFNKENKVNFDSIMKNLNQRGDEYSIALRELQSS